MVGARRSRAKAMRTAERPSNDSTARENGGWRGQGRRGRVPVAAWTDRVAGECPVPDGLQTHDQNRM